MAEKIDRPDRGEYRPIFVALLDGKDFQDLPATERWVLVALKLSLGMLGIAVVPGLVGAVAERTGLTERVVATALKRLRATGWIEQERNVAWLVRGFEFEPSMSADNPKHVTSVRRQIDALPTLAIVERFRQRYPEWFAVEPLRPSDSLTPTNSHRLSHSLSDRLSDSDPIASRITETEDRRTETIPETETSLSAAESPPDPVRYTQHCTAAANRGLRENPLLPGFNELVSSNQDEPPQWRERGIPIAVAERAIYQRAKSYRPKPTRRQPTSLGYFRQAVDDEWARDQGRALEPGINVAPLLGSPAEPIDEYERLARQYEANGAGHAH